MSTAKKKPLNLAEDEMSMEENYENVDYSVEEAEYFLKKAKQAEKDQQVKNGCDDLPDGTIIATSNGEGMSWCCSADSTLVIKHTISTIEAAQRTLKGSPMELMLSLSVAQHMAESMSK